jgi:hypothetical protein
MNVDIRTKAWSTVLKSLATTSEVHISDLPFEDAELHDIRRALREMEKLGWVTRESDRASTVERGPVADMFLQQPE